MANDKFRPAMMRWLLFVIFATVFSGNLRAGDLLWMAAATPAEASQENKKGYRALPSESRKALGIPGVLISETKKRDIQAGGSFSAKFKNDCVLVVECLAMERTRYRLKISLNDPIGPVFQAETWLARGTLLILKGPPENGEAPLFFLAEIR